MSDLAKKQCAGEEVLASVFIIFGIFACLQANTAFLKCVMSSQNTFFVDSLNNKHLFLPAVTQFLANS